MSTETSNTSPCVTRTNLPCGFAEFGNAVRTIRLWQSVSDCLAQSGRRLPKRLLKDALVETFVEETAVVAEHLGREAKYVGNS